ncbi:YceD family protein [Marinobacter bohaiensis]|uniref:YceD family protein n=1 Tax=Marinobacter bohaiensis TaxID=2201898 RepID=UPI000DABD03C|nr:YceD family protein [Marinobacter bohaiensis]
MSNAELPRIVDPNKFAEQKANLEGVIALRCLSRFAGLLQEVEGDVRVHLQFGMDAERRRVVEGRLEAPVVLECQRCMSPMQTTLNSTFKLGLVISDEQARQLPRELEPFLIESFEADLWQLVEDELLLAMPPYPLHERDQCPAAETLESLEGQVDENPADEPEQRENPFSVLAELKKKDDH